MTDAARIAPIIFLRDDDVGALTEPLKFFANLFFDRGLPVSYQIIPAQLTDEAAEFLLALRRRRPDLVEFGQHGLTHKMVVRGRQVWREFGPERSYDEQSDLIRTGAAILRSKLGDAPVEIFTPPQHKYNGDTVRAAAAAGHRIFSGSAYVTPQHQLAYGLGRMLGRSSYRHHGISYHGRARPEAAIAELSISVAIDDGGSIHHSDRSLPAALTAAARTTAAVGLMFHHAVYERSDDRDRLIAIADLLANRADQVPGACGLMADAQLRQRSGR